MMLRLVRIAAAVAKTALAACASYLGLLAVAAWRAHPRGSAVGTPPSTRFAVLIPAHNEERLIESTLCSFGELDYPTDLFTVHVVADHCTDATAELARSSGVAVHERSDPEVPGKGPSLQWLLARIDAAGESVDAFVFVDADTTVDRSFLRELDRSLSAGNAVVQAHYAVRDPDDSQVVAFRAAALAARTYLRPLGRTAIGGSAGLYGNGMAFRPAVLAGRGWSDHLTEDIELYLELLLDGVRVAFAPRARLEAEMPATLEASRSQHERWERGRLDLARRYVPRLVRRTVSGGPAGRVAYADALFDQAVPPFSVLTAGTAVWTSISAVAALVGSSPSRWRRFGAASLVAAIQAGYVVVSLRLVGAPRSVYRSLLGAPKMVLWKLALLGRVARRPSGSPWIRTARN